MISTKKEKNKFKAHASLNGDTALGLKRKVPPSDETVPKEVPTPASLVRPPSSSVSSAAQQFHVLKKLKLQQQKGLALSMPATEAKMNTYIVRRDGEERKDESKEAEHEVHSAGPEAASREKKSRRQKKKERKQRQQLQQQLEQPEQSSIQPSSVQQPQPQSQPRQGHSGKEQPGKHGVESTQNSNKNNNNRKSRNRNTNSSNNNNNSSSSGSNSSSSSSSSSSSNNNQNHSSRIDGKKLQLTPLQEQMQARLMGGQFRWLNEKLYTCKGKEAFDFLNKDPALFETYHRGFRTQVEKWPVNPVDVFVAYLQLHPHLVVGDFGCGDAKIAQTVSNKVHSFDLVSVNEFVTACDIAHVPLKGESLDVCIFSLSLMGTNFMDFLKEAGRVLRPRGFLKIAEVRSRFGDSDDGVQKFVSAVLRLGFTLQKKDARNKMFILFDFVKHNNNNNNSNSNSNNSSNNNSSSSNNNNNNYDNNNNNNNNKNNNHNIKNSNKNNSSSSTGNSNSGGINSARGGEMGEEEPLLKACIYKRR